MRLNAFIAQTTELSRRSADKAISDGRITVNGKTPVIGQQVCENDEVKMDGKLLVPIHLTKTILFNKPAGYVCSRAGQGSKTVYELLPENLRHLNAVGRLDKDSSGLILFTNDGQMAHKLTHPSFQKVKVYVVELDKRLEPLHQQMINDFGISLEDGLSKFQLQSLDDNRQNWQVTMREGRNRQIRRTFDALGYRVNLLHRTHFGEYALNDLKTGEYREA